MAQKLRIKKKKQNNAKGVKVRTVNKAKGVRVRKRR